MSNVEFITELMTFSRAGPLTQVFVIDALLKQARLVAATPAERFERPMFSGAAWVAAAQEVLDRLEKVYGVARAAEHRPLASQRILRAAMRPFEDDQSNMVLRDESREIMRLVLEIIGNAGQPRGLIGHHSSQGPPTSLRASSLPRRFPQEGGVSLEAAHEDFATVATPAGVFSRVAGASHG